MSRYGSYLNNATYYLVCDPVTGKVVKRTREWKLQTATLGFQLKVTKAIWKKHRTGGQLDVTGIHEPHLGRWLAMRALVARNTKLAKDTRKALEELDRDNLGTWPET